MVLHAQSILLGFICGFGAFQYAIHTESAYAYIVGLYGGLTAYYVEQFFATIYTNTIDACFLCFAIDKDANSNHKPQVEAAFADPNQ